MVSDSFLKQTTVSGLEACFYLWTIDIFFKANLGFSLVAKGVEYVLNLAQVLL